MRLKKYLQEEYLGVYKSGGLYTEIYENPNANEIRFMPPLYTKRSEAHLDPEDSVRFIAFAPTEQLFIWKSEGGIHDFVMDYLHTKRKLREVPDLESDGVFAGYAQPQQGKLEFTKGYMVFGNHDWKWLTKYFMNVNKIILYIRANTGSTRGW